MLTNLDFHDNVLLGSDNDIKFKVSSGAIESDMITKLEP